MICPVFRVLPRCIRVPLWFFAGGLSLVGQLQAAAPANDNFVNAATVTGGSGSVSGFSNVTATKETGEPLHASRPGGKSIWFQWSPPEANRYFFTTSGSGFDTLMAAYTGDTVSNLTELASNDDFTDFSSRVSFSAYPGTNYHIAVDGYSGATGTVVLSWGAAFPTNDNFASARALSGFYGRVSGFNFRATAEPSEPHGGNSVWYKWTAPTNMSTVFRTEGSTFDTVLCVYSGNSLGGLTELACDDNSGPNGSSRVTFNAIIGATYRIQVRGANGAMGDIALTWGQADGASIVLLPDLFVWKDQGNSYLYGWTLDRSEIPGHTLLRLSTATPNIGSGPLELRGSTTTPEVYQRIYHADGSYHDRLAGTFTFHPEHGHLHFDDWVVYNLREVLPGDLVGNIIAAGTKTSFAIMDLEGYDLSLPGAAPDYAYSGGLVQGLSVGWADVYDSSLPQQWIDITSVPPGRYWLEAVVDPDNHIQESNEGNNTERILIDLSGGPPPNDNFADAITLSGRTAGVLGNNFLATKQPGEPDHAFEPGGASVWYKWTAPISGPVIINTAGTSFDSVLAVYTGGSVSTLTPIANNDDFGGSFWSQVTFNAVANVQYRIAVDGVSGDSGRVELQINPALNDNFADSLTLAGANGVVTGSNRDATRQSNEPLHAGVTGSNSVWYSWTAPSNGVAMFETVGSGFDTLLAVYAGDGLASLAPVASNDNFDGSGASDVNFDAIAGVTYHIAVDGKQGATGIIYLNWTLGPPVPPTILLPPSSTNVFAGATVVLNVSATGFGTLGYQWRFQGNDLTDGANVLGANSRTLTLAKLGPDNSGSYAVVVTNNYGAVTSIVAIVLVIDNPRIVYAVNSSGPSGGLVTLPVNIQSLGNENALAFSLTFDPTMLSNPRIHPGADAASANVTLDATLLAAGKLGVTLALPPGQTLTSGLREVALVDFDTAFGLPDGTVTPVGFANQPVTRNAYSTSASVLPAVFSAGSVTLHTVITTASGQRLPTGEFQLTISGIRGRSYVIESSPDLSGWTPLVTNAVDNAGLLQFIDAEAPGQTQRFFRARLFP